MTAALKTVLAKFATGDDDVLDVFKPAEADDQASTGTWGATSVFASPTFFSTGASEAKTTSASSREPSITTHSGGFVINATIGSGAPTGFATAVQGAIQYFESTFTNNLTMNITFNWGSSGGVASSNTYLTNYSYSSVVSALQSHDAGIAADSGLVLPSSDPFPASDDYALGTPVNTLWLTNGQATLLGLSSYNSGANTNDDATITLGSSYSYNFNPAGGAVAGEFDATPVFEHEISEVMGRQFGGNNPAGNGLLPEALALFRYSSSGVIDTSDNYADDYFSINGGVTNLRSNMGEQNGDLADWGDATDDIVGYAQEGVAQEFTPVDVQVMEALGWATTPATDDTWNGGTANWNTADDWSAGVPTSNSAVFIPQGDPEITSAASAASITVGSDATLSVGDELTIGSGGLTLDTGSTFNVTTAESFGFTVDVAGNATIDDNGQYFTYLNGAISGAGSLTVAGAGGLVFGTADTGFSGNVTVLGGALVVFNSASLGTGTLTLDDNSNFEIGDDETITNNIDINGDETLYPYSGDDVTFSGVIANGASTGSLGINGGGTAVLTGVNTYTGGTTVTGGTTLSISAPDNISATSLTLDNATLELTGATASYYVPITLENASTIFNTASGNPYFDGIIGGAGSLTVSSSGSGGVALLGTNSYSGGTTVTAGSDLAIFNDDALGSNTLTLDDSFFQASTDATVTNAITAIGAVYILAPPGETPTLSGIISDGSSPGALTFYDDGTITLTGANTYSGGTTINSPTTVAISGAGTLGTGGVTLDSGATLSIGAGAAPAITGTSSFAGTVSGAGTWSLGAGDDTIASGAKITVTKWSATGATVTLDEALTYSGPFTGGAGSVLDLNGFNLTLKGATTLSGASTAGTGRLVDSGATTISGGLTIGGTQGMTTSAAVTVKSGNVTLGDAGGDKATLSNTSAGVWNFTDASGIVHGANAGSLFTNQGLFEKTAGAVSVIAASFTNTGTVDAKVGIIDFAGPLTTMSGLLQGGAVQFTAGATSFTSGANVTVSQISLSGASSMTIAASLTYSGKFTQSTGTTLSINPGEILTLSGAATLNGVVHGSGELLMSGGTLALGVGGPILPGSWVNTGEAITITGSRGYSGTFSADSSTKINLTGGALALTGTSTLTGATLAGSKSFTLAGPTTINGLTIGGTGGLVNKKTTTESGGNVTLGDSTGDKTTLTNISTGVWDIADDSGIALGKATTSTIANAGLLEKTGGTTTTGSAIAPGITNTGTIRATSGVLDLQGAISGTGKDIVSGASTLIFESTVASGQTVSFTGAGGALQLLDPQGFAATISDFDAGGASGDTLALSDVWTYTGFTENAGHTQGTMSFTDGGQSASVLFAGNYNSTLFHSVTNSGGTFVTYG